MSWTRWAFFETFSHHVYMSLDVFEEHAAVFSERIAAPLGDRELYLIVDNASSHRTKAVRDHLARRSKRFVVHFTPTRSSWLNLVDRWFAGITTKRIRRASFAGVKDLEHAIMDYIHHWNESGRRFVWTKSPKQMLPWVRKAVQSGVSSRSHIEDAGR